MFGLLNSVIDLATNTATVVLKPVEIAVDLTNAAVKPLAEVAKDVADEVKKLGD
jgi:hypothetical protein